MDETRAPVLDPGRKATRSGYFRAVVTDDRGHGGVGPPIALFHYAPGRGKEHPLRFLAGYRGRFLQCDAYQSYNALTEITRDTGPWRLVYCWTHVRRRFVKRFENEGSPIAEEMLRQIALLYQIERTVRGKDAAVRLAARREHAAPIIAALKPDYLKNPRVSVQVLNYRPFYIIGEVNSPGSYAYVSGMTVLEAVAIAGGFTYRAKEGEMTITRGSDDARREAEAVPETLVLPGDVIKVPERFF